MKKSSITLIACILVVVPAQCERQEQSLPDNTHAFEAKKEMVRAQVLAQTALTLSDLYTISTLRSGTSKVVKKGSIFSAVGNTMRTAISMFKLLSPGLRITPYVQAFNPFFVGATSFSSADRAVHSKKIAAKKHKISKKQQAALFATALASNIFKMIHLGRLGRHFAREADPGSSAIGRAYDVGYLVSEGVDLAVQAAIASAHQVPEQGKDAKPKAEEEQSDASTAQDQHEPLQTDEWGWEPAADQPLPTYGSDW